MNKLLLVCLSLLISVTCYSKVLLVSDLDDTIKITGMKSSSMYTNYLKGVDPFPNLINIYNDIIEHYLQKGEVVEVVYLTSSPRIINSSKWLRKNNAPYGRVINRSNSEVFKIDGYEFKTRELKKLLENHQEYSQIYLFGDNGEHDPFVYSDLMRKMNLTNVQAYIRDVMAYTACDGYEYKLRKGLNYFLSERELLESGEILSMTKNRTQNDILNSSIDEIVPDFIDDRIKENCGTNYKGLL